MFCSHKKEIENLTEQRDGLAAQMKATLEQLDDAITRLTPDPAEAPTPTHFVEVSISTRGLYRCDLVDTKGAHVMIHSGRGLSQQDAQQRSIDIANGVIEVRDPSSSG